MLKVNRGIVEVKGRTDILLAELSGLIFSLRENQIAPDELIRNAIEKGFLSKEEIHNRASNIMEKMSTSELLDAINDFFGTKESL